MKFRVEGNECIDEIRMKLMKELGKEAKLDYTEEEIQTINNELKDEGIQLYIDTTNEGKVIIGAKKGDCVLSEYKITHFVASGEEILISMTYEKVK